jgi:hypothetical protein
MGTLIYQLTTPTAVHQYGAAGCDQAIHEARHLLHDAGQPHGTLAYLSGDGQPIPFYVVDLANVCRECGPRVDCPTVEVTS